VDFSSRFALHLDAGNGQEADDYATTAMENAHRRLGRARSSGHRRPHRRNIRAAVLAYIDRRQREAAMIAANTGPVRVLMRDGVWLVPENERPETR